MRRRHRERLILIVGLVVVVIIIIAVILLLIFRRKKIEYLNLTPTFQETELDVNSDYIFMVTTEPEGIKLKDLEYVVDDPTAVFATASEDNTQAVLHTGAEGKVTIYVKQGKVGSGYITYDVVDITARAQREAEAQAEQQALIEAQQQMELEQAAAAEEIKLYVKTTDNVRMRSSASTESDGNILKKTSKGDKFVKTGVETGSDGKEWTVVDDNGTTGYIRSDFVQEISEDEYKGGMASDAQSSEEEKKKAEEKKPEEKKPENTAQADNGGQQQAQPSAEEQQAAALAKQQEEAQKALEAQQQALLEQQAQAAALAAAQAAAGRTINCTDGTMTVTPAQYQLLDGYWSYTGDTDGMISHHSKAEIQNLFALNGL